MPDRVRVALIGAGNFARNLHLPNIARLSGASLHAVCDLRQDVLDGLQARYRPAYVTADHARLLKDPDVDAVVIAVRDDLQAGLATAFLEAGKHVYVEKPLAVSPEQAAPVIAAQQKANRLLAVGFNRRYAPIYRAAREILSAAGGARNIHLKMTDDAWRWAHGYAPGYLIQHDVCHLFDLLRWLCACDVVSVYCASARPDDDAMVLRMANGTVATVTNSGHGTMDMPKERFEAVTERGGVVAEDFVELRTYGLHDQPAVQTFAGQSNPDREFMHKYLYRHLGAEALHAVRRVTWELREQVVNDRLDPNQPDAEEIRRYVQNTIPNFMRDQGWLDAMRAFVAAIQGGATKTEHASAADALAAAQVAAAAVRSRDTGEVVKVARTA